MNKFLNLNYFTAVIIIGASMALSTQSLAECDIGVALTQIKQADHRHKSSCYDFPGSSKFTCHHCFVELINQCLYKMNTPMDAKQHTHWVDVCEGLPNP